MASVFLGQTCRVSEVLSGLASSKCHSQVHTTLRAVLRGCFIGRERFFLAVFFQKPETRGSSECQFCRRTGNKNWRWEWLSGTLLCELSLTLARELLPCLACSQNTMCRVCVSGLGELSEDRAGLPDHWNQRDSWGPCRTFPVAGIWVILMVLTVFPWSDWVRKNSY